MDAVHSTLIYVNVRLSTLYICYHGISSRVSTSINFPELLSRVVKSMGSMVSSALPPLEVSDKSIPALVASYLFLKKELFAMRGLRSFSNVKYLSRQRLQMHCVRRVAEQDVKIL